MNFKNKYLKLNYFWASSFAFSLTFSALVLVLGAAIPNSVFPNSFPTFYEKRNGEVLAVQESSKVPVFNPSFVISDYTFRSKHDFPNTSSIQNFLKEVNSPLANYSESNQSAAKIIYEAANGVSSARNAWNGKLITPNLNPALILTKLETEQNLLSLTDYNISADKDRRIAKATGYACYDNEACNDSKKGFFNQVTGLAWQLEYNYQISNDSSFSDEPYQVGKTITTLDNQNVYLSNASTAAFYRYTPHVYWGNYNIWKIVTSFGWGVSGQKWSKTDLDNANLKNKTAAVYAQTSSSPDIKNTDYTANLALIQKDYVIGQRSDEILQLQNFLREEGYFVGDSSGMFGLITRQALERYRQENGIKVAVSSADSCQILLEKNFKSGTVSSEVKDLQQCLREKGFFKYALNTGKYATLTKEAHDNYRKSKNNSTKEIKATSAVVKPATSVSTGLSNSSCASLKRKFYKIDEQSPEITKLQQCMKDAGVYNFRITGLYGYVTDAALVKWKKMK